MGLTIEKYEVNQNLILLIGGYSFRYKELINQLDYYKSQNEKGKMKIIDIGCASGKLFSILNDKYDIKYLGIELNPKMVESAKKNSAILKTLKLYVMGLKIIMINCKILTLLLL